MTGLTETELPPGPRRPVATAAVVYLVLSLILFAPGLAPEHTLSASDYLWTATPWDSARPADIPPLGSNRELADSVTLFQPALQLTRAALPDVPLWDPYTLGGRPFLADSQSAVFSLFSLPAYVLPFWKSLAVMAALKLFVAALGAFLLGRALGMRFWGALMCGLVFGFSLWSVTWVSWTTMSVWALLPWLCLLAELCVRRPGPGPLAGLAAVVGLQFLGGHPSSSFQVLVFVVIVWVGRALATPSMRTGLAPRLLTLFGALALGTALAAVMLIPFVELLANSSDLSSRSEGGGVVYQPARFLFGIFLHDYWGAGTSALEFASALEEHAYYVAALPLMLALAAPLLRARGGRLVALGVGVVALMVATGLPPVYTLVGKLPGFSASNNGRVAVITVLCIALLAGWGLDDLSRARPAAARRRVLFSLGAVLLLAPLVVVATGGYLDPGTLGPALKVGWGFADPTAKLAGAAENVRGLVRLASLLEWLVVASLALMLLGLRLSGRLGPAAFVALAALLVAVDLFKAGMGYNPAIPVSHAEQPVTPALRFLQDRRPARFAGLEPSAAFTLLPPLPPDLGMRYRIADARGYVVPYERRYLRYWRRAVAPDPGCFFLFCTLTAADGPASLRALGLLGVSLLLESRRDGRRARLPVAYEGTDARIYRNPGALPRAFLVGRQRVVSSADAALDAVTAATFRPRSEVVTEERIDGLNEGPGVAGSARISNYERERVVIESDARKRAVLVLTDTWYPGWKASVDGRDAPVRRVDYLLRGIEVPPGRHRVELRFKPASVTAGYLFSGAALLVVLGAGGLALPRHFT